MSRIDLRNLPAPVLERLGSAAQPDGGESLRVGFDVVVAGRRGSPLVESRARQEIRLEGESDESRQHVGYATVYDVAYEVAGGKDSAWGWDETIVGGAADKSVRERDDVRYLTNHAGLPLARTASRTLRLESDSNGLLSDATVDLRRSDGHDLTLAIEAGDVDAMSFAFRALRQEWNDDYTERWITEVMLFDTSAVTYPANPATVIGVRSEDLDPPDPGMPFDHARAVVEMLRSRAS